MQRKLLAATVAAGPLLALAFAGAPVAALAQTTISTATSAAAMASITAPACRSMRAAMPARALAGTAPGAARGSATVAMDIGGSGELADGLLEQAPGLGAEAALPLAVKTRIA